MDGVAPYHEVIDKPLKNRLFLTVSFPICVVVALKFPKGRCIIIWHKELHDTGVKKGKPMHEYSLTKQLVQILCDTATANGAKRVNCAHIVIGKNTAIIPESVQLYYDMIAKGTVAEGATLHMRIIEPEMHCQTCGKNFIRPRFSFACPVCGALGRPTEIGNEYYIERVELET